MQSFAVQVLTSTLRYLARLTLLRYRPGIVGITGTVGKTSTKLAVAAVLRADRRVRVSRGNLNNELGLPVTILGEWKDKELALVSRDTPAGTRTLAKIFFWAKVISTAVFRLVVGKKEEYPEMLVLEYGADRPEDIKKLLKIARPDTSIITAIGYVPVHVEFYSGPDDVAREKARLIEWLPSASFAILNYDDESVMNLKDRTRAHVMSYGFAKGADVRIKAFEHRVEGNEPRGVVFKLEYAGNSVPVRIENTFGKVQAYAASAAASVGLIFGMNLVKIAEALKTYQPAHGRMELLVGIKDSRVIHDAYNASPLSMHAALDTLKSLPGKKKIAVLGDMKELGKYSLDAHQAVGRLTAKDADMLITVGPHAKFIAEGAREAGMQKRNILCFDTAEDAQGYLPKLIRKGDLVLVKGSRAMHLEILLDELRAVSL